MGGGDGGVGGQRQSGPHGVALKSSYGTPSVSSTQCRQGKEAGKRQGQEGPRLVRVGGRGERRVRRRRRRACGAHAAVSQRPIAVAGLGPAAVVAGFDGRRGACLSVHAQPEALKESETTAWALHLLAAVAVQGG